MSDTNKKVSETPRTQPVIAWDTSDSGFIVELASECSKTEQKLNAANYEVQHLREAYIQLQEGIERQRQRIRRMEEAGDRMEEYILDQTNTRFIICAVQWREAKEDKL